MSLSLSDIKFPESWELIPNERNYIDYVYKESVELGVWRPDNKRDLIAHNNVVSLSKFFWPNMDFERLVMGGELMVWFFTFDDALDAGIYNDEQQAQVVKRMSDVFMNGTVEDDASGPEKMALHLRNKCEVMCGERKDTFNRFISSCIQWVDSIIPFNKIKIDGASPDIELYSYLRKINIGAFPCVTLTEVMLDHEIDHYVWYDPRWIKMNEDIAIITTLINDLVSYEKEVNDNAGDLNPLFFIQKQRKVPLTESFKEVVGLINHWVKDFTNLEESFMKSHKFKNSKQKRDFECMLEHLHYLASGSKLWSMQTPRYCSPTSPFIEMRKQSSSPNLTNSISIPTNNTNNSNNITSSPNKKQKIDITSSSAIFTTREIIN
ncbi:hypothetical protein DICPUDRAFT_152610 [Dictyostelium purpureum]|uniref:Terpene synthase 1 n=1 Tax=Dictyostelium purpureum TaxID=5786 RepID=TPS1_DICPU|nr:uncharacterized protein DICPUDRAFT_152610 [Dictyostelium purpureum]F0ZLU4.1 RecName: Full=Terpene synthase 1 [Dictyostelium purpureum]AXN72970.1 terpene synthase [Dictyostelium purpureum]EGC35090.1 hypothetical protein DICPUDRAFT_152610 [Dictyostelium purpureum]|eukprot:XP_003288397.1 hypothetical protein DICPUDRAFT_152610 [Dictyostelium purpureum]